MEAMDYESGTCIGGLGGFRVLQQPGWKGRENDLSGADAVGGQRHSFVDLLQAGGVLLPDNAD